MQGNVPNRWRIAAAGVAMQVALDAIARSDGTREDVLAKMFETNLSDSVIGPIQFNEEGDPEPGTEQLFKAVDGRWVWQQRLQTD